MLMQRCEGKNMHGLLLLSDERNWPCHRSRGGPQGPLYHECALYSKLFIFETPGLILYSKPFISKLICLIILYTLNTTTPTLETIKDVKKTNPPGCWFFVFFVFVFCVFVLIFLYFCWYFWHRDRPEVWILGPQRPRRVPVTENTLPTGYRMLKILPTLNTSKFNATGWGRNFYLIFPS